MTLKKTSIILMIFGLLVFLQPSLFAQEIIVLTDDSPNAHVISGSARIYGSPGTNQITIDPGTRTELFNLQGTNFIRINCDVSGFTFSRSGSHAILHGADGTFAKIPASPRAQAIVFNNIRQDLVIVDGHIMIGSQILPSTNTPNQRPVAESVSLKVDSSIPYFEQQLIGHDPDGDILSYDLVSPSSGPGYSFAYINPKTGMLYITNEPAGNDTFELQYHVTDGRLFSEPAKITVTVDYLSEDQKSTGKNEVDPLQYAGFNLSAYNSHLLGGDTPTLPVSIDLSSNFPKPGDQGRQGSCVGWATAYAVKSYHERIEMGWSLNTDSHLFSPAFIYNQINGGRDKGSYIFQALDLAVEKGIATLNTMPYSHTDFLTLPSRAALSEASGFKASEWYRINDTAQIKAALINRSPVIAGIKVYDQLHQLKGPDSVYNTASGEYRGGHAVTVTGYDDNRFGGAFKVINSWGTKWGDDGYFWLPYRFAAQDIMMEAYVMLDAENTQVQPPDPNQRTEPEPDTSRLPNLSILSWEATYDPRPKGAGTLTFSVANTGTATATAGANISLMLSRDTTINSSDYFVIYETIPFDLEPGESVFRNDDNALTFNLPDRLEPGEYYLALWVDDQNVVRESNERDNISLSENTITITSSLPDLKVNAWYAEWDNFGNGQLTFEVINTGESPTSTLNWDIALILDKDQEMGNGNEILLYREMAAYYLNNNDYIYRDESTAARFNIFEDRLGNPVPPGIYHIALWVDTRHAEEESNSLNNGSYNWGGIPVFGWASTVGSTVPDDDPGLYDGCQDFCEMPVSMGGHAYNGKKLPENIAYMKQVDISKTPSGGNRLILPEQKADLPPLLGKQTAASYEKTTAAEIRAIFPISKKISMP